MYVCMYVCTYICKLCSYANWYAVYAILYLVTILSAGASCVRWNRLDSHMLASAHDSDIRIWDSRVSDYRTA